MQSGEIDMRHTMTPTGCWKLDLHHSGWFHLLFKDQWALVQILSGKIKRTHAQPSAHPPHTRDLTYKPAERKFYRFWHFWLHLTPLKSTGHVTWKWSIDYRFLSEVFFYLYWIESATALLSSAIPEVMKESS